jgi:hypothetical protein
MSTYIPPPPWMDNDDKWQEYCDELRMRNQITKCPACGCPSVITCGELIPNVPAKPLNWLVNGGKCPNCGKQASS